MSLIKKKYRRPVRRFFKHIRHYISYLLARIFIMIMWPIPLDVAMKVGKFIGLLGYYLAKSERDKVIKNLKIAYGDQLDEKHRQSVAKEVFKNIGIMTGENLILYRDGITPFLDRIELIGFENIRENIESEKGLIGITAHLDNWELLAAYFSKARNVNFAVIARRLKNKYVDKLLEQFRAKTGVRVFWREDGTRDLIRFLKKEKGGILGLLADQNFKGDGIYLDFFGNPAFTPKGPAELIIFSKFDFFPLFIHRNPDRKTHTIEILPIVSIELTGNKDENIKTITKIYTEKIEEQIRKFPEQWMWIHQRWRDPR